MTQSSSVLLEVPLPCKLLSLQVQVIQLLEPPLLTVVAREAGDQAGMAEVEAGVEDEG